MNTTFARLALAALAWAALAFSPSPAESQTACPAFTQGRVLTPAQWQACFDAKQNNLGYTPVNKAGDTMLGRLQLSPSTGTRAGLNIGVGTGPVSKINGDVWMSVAGMFAQVNNVTVGPFGSALTTQAASTLVANCQVFPAIPGECTIGSTLAFVGTALQTTAMTGDVATSANSFATTIAANAVTYAKFQQVAASSLVGNPTGSPANAQGVTLGATLTFSGTALQTLAITGDATASANSFATTVGKVNGVAYPAGPSSNTVPVVTGANTVTYQAVPNAALANSSMTIAGTSVALGGSITASAILDSVGSTRGSLLERGASGWAALTPGTAGLALTSGGAGADPAYAALANAALQNSTITIGSTSMALGSTNTTIAGSVAFSGTLNASGTFQIGGTALALPVPLAVGGTAANLTASNGGVIYSTASAFAVLSGTVTAGQCLLSGSSAAPSWGSCAGGAAVASVSNADGSLTVSPTTGAVVASLNLANANAWTAQQTIAVSNARAFSAGLTATNPALNVDTTTASSVTGFNIKSAAAGGGVAVQAISTGTNENLSIDAKGSGTITLGGTSTGSVTISRALTYGGVTLTNSVVGTGSMVLSSAGCAISTCVSGLGTGIATALAVNTGTAGAPAILIAKGTSALGTSAIGSGTCATVVTTAATGTATTDAVDASFNADPSAVTGYAPSTSGMLTILSYPTSGNVNFKVCNNTGASITPGAITLNWAVRR